MSGSLLGRRMNKAAQAAAVRPKFPASLCHRHAGAGPPAERARPGRFLCAGAVLVAVVLRGRAGARARPGAQPAMLRAAVFLRGAWAMAAIRAGLPGILPTPGAAARPHHRRQHARPDAKSAADLPRMGPARNLLGAFAARLFRSSCAKRAPRLKSRRNSSSWTNRSRSSPTTSRTPSSRPMPRLSRAERRGGLRQQALERSARMLEQGFFLPRLPRGDAPRLQARQHRHAGGARRMNGV